LSKFNEISHKTKRGKILDKIQTGSLSDILDIDTNLDKKTEPQSTYNQMSLFFKFVTVLQKLRTV
jgi:hypothetical protein